MNPNEQNPAATPEAPKRPPLVRCIFEGDASAVPPLIAAGEDPNAIYYGRSLVSLATYDGSADVLAALIAGGASVPPDALSVLGEMEITDFKIDPAELEPVYARIAEILLAHGASPNATAYNGQPLITTFPKDLYPNIHRVLADAIARSPDTIAALFTVSNRLQKLLDFLNALERHKIRFQLEHHRKDAITVRVVVPAERWEIQLFADGKVEVETFRSMESGVVGGHDLQTALKRSLADYTD